MGSFFFEPLQGKKVLIERSFPRMGDPNILRIPNPENPQGHVTVGIEWRMGIQIVKRDTRLPEALPDLGRNAECLPYSWACISSTEAVN